MVTRSNNDSNTMHDGSAGTPDTSGGSGGSVASAASGSGAPRGPADGGAHAYRSPLLGRSGAAPVPEGVPGVSLDSGVAWHQGDPFAEQHAAARGCVVVDRSQRPVLRIGGTERLSWLHSLTSQHLEALPAGNGAEDLVLNLKGRIQEHFVLTDRDGTLWLDTEPGHGASLLEYLDKMVFWADVQPARDDDMAVLTLLGPDAGENDSPLAGLAAIPTGDYESAALPGGGFVRRMPWPQGGSLDLLVPRTELVRWWDRLAEAGAVPAGMWAYEAMRVESLRPRLSVDTDDRTIPHEVRWIGGPDEAGAVHLNKGCYLGQETVARVHNLGKPPRNLLLLHLDGSDDRQPVTGDPVSAGGRTVGRVGTVVQHHEFGPVALALVKRSVGAGTELIVGECAAAVDPDSIPPDDRVQAGRAAVDKLRGH